MDVALLRIEERSDVVERDDGGGGGARRAVLADAADEFEVVRRILEEVGDEWRLLPKIGDPLVLEGC